MNKKDISINNVLIIVFFLSLMMLTTYVLYRQVSHKNELTAFIQTEKSAVDNNMTQAEILNKYKDTLGQKQKELAEFEFMLPSEPSESTLISYLQNTAAEANINLNNVVFDARVAKEGYTEMPVKLTFKGSFDGIVKLLDTLKNGKRLICLDNVRMYSNDNKSELIIELAARAFYMTNQP